jgi:hypothetical protein
VANGIIRITRPDKQKKEAASRPEGNVERKWTRKTKKDTAVRIRKGKGAITVVTVELPTSKWFHLK